MNFDLDLLIVSLTLVEKYSEVNIGSLESESVFIVTSQYSVCVTNLQHVYDDTCM